MSCNYIPTEEFLDLFWAFIYVSVCGMFVRVQVFHERDDDARVMRRVSMTD